MKNRIVQLGYLGMRTCYLNVSDDEAIKRFLDSDDTMTESDKAVLRTKHFSVFQAFEFDDSFGAYDLREL